MKRIRLGVAASLLSAGALGCAAGGSDAEGYVLLDQEARQAGVSIEVDRRAVDSALPVAVSAEERVVLHHGATEEPVTVSPPATAVAQGPGAGSAMAAGLEGAASTTPRVVSPGPVVFGPALACPGVAGVWRGRAYSDRHGAYYDFTLTVAQAGSRLKGTLVAEFWDGATDEVEPPAACAASKQHVKVVESASGTVDADGTMRFASTSWQVGSHLCGERVTNYSADRFVVPLADGAASAHSTASDDGMWVDGMLVDLTRVSCR